MKCELYRHFDKDGMLLYAGISLSAVSRLCAHSSRATWYEQVTKITIERFSTRQEAMIAERETIIREKPLHNYVVPVLKSFKAGAVIFDLSRQESTRLNETRKLLRARTETLEDIAKATGVGLSWLQKLSGNDELNPRVKPLEKVNRYLRKVRQ